MRLAAIDIGTNSVLLAVAEQSNDGALRLVEEQCMITRLGQGVDGTGCLLPEAINRTLAALNHYSQQITRLGIMRYAAIGTSALREAQNGALFTERAAALLGCPVEVVSGQREAQLMLEGVHGAFPDLPPSALVFDVGGGSTEIISTHEPPLSLPLGAVRLTERFFTQDPPLPQMVQHLEQTVDAALAQVQTRAATPLIAVGGTATTLATMHLRLAEYDTSRVNGLWLTEHQIRAQARRFSTMSLTSRQQVIGLEPARADVILAGILIITGILKRFSERRTRVCDQGVRWGLLRQLAGQ